MLPLTKRLWFDQDGAVLSAELVLIVTILVLGLIVGLSSLQNAIVWELTDISRAFSNLNQSYFFSAHRGCRFKGAFVAGSSYYDVNESLAGCDYGYGYGGLSQPGYYGAYGSGGSAATPGLGVSCPPNMGAVQVEPNTILCPDPTLPGQGPMLTPGADQVHPQPELKTVPNKPSPDTGNDRQQKEDAKPATAA